MEYKEKLTTIEGLHQIKLSSNSSKFPQKISYLHYFKESTSPLELYSVDMNTFISNASVNSVVPSTLSTYPNSPSYQWLKWISDTNNNNNNNLNA